MPPEQRKQPKPLVTHHVAVWSSQVVLDHGTGAEVLQVAFMFNSRLDRSTNETARKRCVSGPLSFSWDASEMGTWRKDGAAQKADSPVLTLVNALWTPWERQG